MSTGPGRRITGVSSVIGSGEVAAADAELLSLSDSRARYAPAMASVDNSTLPAAAGLIWLQAREAEIAVETANSRPHRQPDRSSPMT